MKKAFENNLFYQEVNKKLYMQFGIKVPLCSSLRLSSWIGTQSIKVTPNNIIYIVILLVILAVANNYSSYLAITRIKHLFKHAIQNIWESLSRY